MESFSISAIARWVEAHADIGGFIAMLTFCIWGWRKNSLQNKKLVAELEKLRRENSRIYRPTLDEIGTILTKTNQWRDRARNISGTVPQEVGVFFVAFHRFFRDLLASRGDPKAQHEIMTERLASVMSGVRTDDTNEFREPSPKFIIQQWSMVKPMVERRLDQELVERIDGLLETVAKQSGAD